MADTNVQKKSVIISPRQTEKAVIAEARQNVRVFNVTENATKKSVAASIKQAFNVTPLAVRMARTPKKTVFVRGKRGVKGGVKKAYVTLKKGDTINA